MKLDQLAHFLEAASGPVPKLNNQIARILGYTTVANPDPSAKKKLIWITPEGTSASHIPNYTGNIDEAISFLDAIAAPAAAGFIVRDGRVLARVNDDPPVEGSTPALALCIAAVKTQHKLNT